MSPSAKGTRTVHNAEDSPRQPVSEQIPHSGIHNDEFPVNNFDHTSLQTAVDRSLVSPTPDTVAELASSEEIRKKPNKRRRNILLGSLALLAGGAITAGAFLGINSSNQNQGQKPPKATETSAPANPTETTAPKPTAETITVASFEIPSNLTPEQVGDAVVDRLTKWYTAGTNDSTYEERLAFKEDGKATSEVTADFVTQKANEYSKVISEALFVPNYQDTDQIERITNNNASILEDYIITHEDGSVYTYSMTTDSTTILAQSADSLTLKILATEHNNAAQNRIGTTYDPDAIKIDGHKTEMTATLKVIDGKYKIVQLK